MKAYYNIYLTIDDVRVWMNKYTSKMSFTFAENLCSTAWKSAVDTASCKLIFNDRNVVELSDIVSKIVEAQQSFPQKEIQFEALNADESKTIFRGSLDLGKLSIESSKIPGSISITAKSPIDKLGKKPKANFVLYPATVKDVVERCVAEAGLGLIVEWKASISGKQLEVPFVVTDEDSDTWRDKIDTLLMEMGGCTLSFDHNGNKFYISKVNDESKAFSDIPVNYHVQSKLKSTTTKFAKDGVVVSYGNLKISKDQTVYYHDINLEKKDSFLKGDEIKPGVYYPFDSDITKTFEEYEESNLDYGTLIGNTRKANNHINLFYVDPASTKVTIIASDMNGKGISDWYSNETFISKEGGFTYPGGGAFYPRKAWLCFKNNTEKSVNITQFSISGDTYYSDTEYRIVMPLDCEDPEEYSAKYIADTETAKTLASFLMNQKRFGSDTSTWTERWENHSLGDKVKIQHKSGNIINAIIVKKESIIYGDELWAKITAVSLDGWSYEQPALVQNNVQSPSILDPYDNAVRNGYVGSREQWESRNDIFYLWSSSETELKPKKRAFWKLGGKWMLFANLPVGDFGMQDWMKSWAEVMADRTEEYNYLWAKVGLDGEPFLLQGVSPMDFSFVVSPSNYVVNPRNLSAITLTITLSRQNGIKGTSSLEFVGTHTGITLAKAEGNDVWTVSIAQRSNTSLSFKVSATIGKVTKVLEIAGQLVGNEAKCIGWVSELPQYTQEGLNIIEGDTCILNGTPMIFNGSSWDTVNDISSLPYEMGVAIGNTALFSGNDITQSMSILWAFIQNLYAQSALIENIRTSNITMEGNGIIRSKDVLDGHIGDKQLPVTGYALDGQNGRLQSNKAFIANANVVNATINTATLSAIRSDNFNFGRRSSLTVGYGFSWTYGSYVGPFTFFKQIVSVMSQGVMTPSYFSGSATVNGSSVSNGYVFYDIESMCLYFSTQESTSNPQIKMRFNESDSKVYVSINSGSESQLSSATINVSVTCPEGLPTCISLYPWNNDSSNIGVYKSSIGSPRVPFDSIFGKIGLFDDIRIGYLDSISDGSYYLDGTGEWSIKLPGKKIMKWKYLYRTGNDSAEWRTWTFATQFPAGCDFAFAVPVKSDQNRDAYYYGYMGALSSTYVNFSTWGLFDYFCIAIGS